jgi:AcrR family transcriptional regulator
VLDAARRQFMGGQRVDLQAISAETGVARATLYSWFGSRDGLLSEVLYTEAILLLERSRARASGKGTQALLETFDRINRGLSGSAPLRSFLEREREGALRILTSSGGTVQPRVVAAIAEMIEAEERAGAFESPIDVGTLAYAIVRLAESFIYNDAVAGIRGDIEPLREVEAALIGAAPRRS